MAVVTNSQVSPSDDAMRAERRRLWLERAARELETATLWEASRDPAALVTHLDRMIELAARTECLSPEDKLDLARQARAVEVKVYERHIDHLLEQTMVVTRDRDRQTERGELLRRVNDALNIAARLGISAAIKQRVADRLDIIRHTSAAGDSTTAKVEAEKEAARIDEVAHPRELRAFTRWHKPSLVVAIAGRQFSTLDWSLGGMLLGEVDNHGWKCGQAVDVKIGLPDGKLHTDKMLIVRYIPEQKRLAIRSRRFTSVLMQVKRDCDTTGQDPV